ncbi:MULTISPECIES: LexA family protein [Delftia]|uniref:SOS-response transcriptional repressor LexA (RecA-mediated autopeptidase) n=1 Tax=Delftia lacustris TaxID=558537 RepID=A0A1H3PBD7_9BURK|nr:MULTISPECIES: S24 family peptidase [Delftia]MBK0114568.1 helix-turn-helix domain-containing protein [Delftia sp. S65]MBK0121121.1 helix-turn-helix domain-containing protein [Delftia sp. S67]MBK0131929.1 helix-turn-helix domain-containing protein [Delftia sp. S66]MCA1069932.1 LexA repressor [Delftia acidovorans]QPR35638.1 helix-turn-helix domain-containing protein [Delftia acidovorans]
MKLKDWIKAARLHQKWTQEELGEAIGRSKANVGHWENGVHEPKFDQLVAIASATGFPPPALRLPSGKAENRKGMRQYPVLSHTQAAALAEVGALPELTESIEFGKDDASARAFFLELEGNAMSPEFREGDRVLIDPQASPQPGDFVVASSGKRQVLLRKYRVREVDEKGVAVFELVPLNEDHALLCSDKNRLVLIGTMIGLWRRFPRPPSNL